MKVVAFERSVQGTGASRRLRNSGKTPGIIYGSKDPAVVIELDHNALFHALRKEAFHSSILDLEIGGKAQKVLLRDYQMHPFKPLVLHIDFQRVSATEKIHMRIPLHFTHADESTAVKLQGAIISHIANDLEISCLPADLPEFIEVNLANIEVGHSIHAKDVALPKGVSLVLHVEQENPVLVNARIPTVKAADTEEAAPAAAAAPAAGAAAPADAPKEKDKA
ncbi:50S ribosomal protein L25/general stress protein Ctc [Polynucleobacter paneuropaeus]|jgi:large subunit ribosomal protein L25|uniref:Large ribosomal subunit protein bL25 n=1 Tax=Polynucleobacter paneuropaeus TaxID=2527775 RepID=A0A2Z4JU68_9BURK|nr:50S ribosomal protein L25/general stress protein Ctc [Polynucleobacter paneuropaeus]AWW45059.1 50S ribosomal protein L25 [Polynucleobacter paneuropaeus]AWW46858.1 50S ribosomal protein L25 [Polynucleobacter paneuropaeus]AWW48594.1 50S ribosomal protein L25 [Polynucleobacter paneuropaeus]AWW50428.1 50S ribosomal protein L25 [Polynucleobacter paneuropaeus]MBT8514879.1 50S ribosomal protein L25/general stress protein Ctc [Polynucleobacter paneuropaeus]